MTMCLIHNWKRMPEPNEVRASIRYCKWCKKLQKFNVHGFRFPLRSGHWMPCTEGLGLVGNRWQFIDKWEEPIIEAWIESLTERS